MTDLKMMINDVAGKFLGGIVDTHRHLGGSCSPKFLLHAMEIGACPILPWNELERKMVCMPDEPFDFQHFLSKFKFLDKISWTEDLVAEKMKYVCDQMNDEYLDGVFLDFSVSKYRHIGWSLIEAITFIVDRLDEYSDIPIVPILSIKYESPEESQFKIARIVNEESLSDRIGGIDFVGDEAKFNKRIQGPICDMWKGKFVRMHVGESQSVNNIHTAIKDFDVTNIAHGIKVLQRHDTTRLAIDNHVVFDIAPTSNLVCGVINGYDVHPAKDMFDSGITMTVGSDDPIQLSTNVNSEYMSLLDHGMHSDDLKILSKNSRDQLDKWREYSIGG